MKKDTLKKSPHHPKWLNLLPIQVEETLHLPEWLNLDDPRSIMQEIKEGKPRLPEWLSTENGEIIAEVSSSEQTSWNYDYNYLTLQDKNFLQKRGLYDLIIGSPNETIQLIIKQIKYMERTTKITLSRERIIESAYPIIREKAEIEELQKLKKYIQQKNDLITPDLTIPINFRFPSKKDFSFNYHAESQHYKLSRTIFDVETSKQTQKPICVGAYNFEANRLVIAIRSKERAGEFHAINENLYLIFTPNLWEGVFFADVELIIATIFMSALMEGHNNLTSILDKINLPPKLQINTRILEEHLNSFPLRRSIWGAHYAQFDIDMLNWTHKQSKYKFTFFEKTLPHETVTYYLGRPIDPQKAFKNREIKKKAYKVNQYNMHLGNHDAGFRFRIKADIKNKKSIFRCNLSPIQKDSFTNLWIIDTFTISLAMRNPEHSLKALSKNTKFPKKEYKTYDFPIKELDIFTKQEITKPIEYLIFDLFSTLAVYEKQTQGLDYAELENLLKETAPNFKFGINWRPRTSKIVSTATITKETIFNHLEAITGLTKTQIENNIAHERLHQQNFELVYSGGVNEALTWGILESDFETNELIYYDDFQGLYDSIARIAYGELIYKLAAERKLHTLLNTDLNNGKKDFWNVAKHIIKTIRQRLKGRNVFLPDNIFQELIGTVEIDTTHPLQIRTSEIITTKKGEKRKGARCWKLLKGHKPLHLIDLLNAVIRAAIEFDQDINVLESQIKFLKIERYNFSKYPIPKWGEEFFTRIVKLRLQKIAEDNPIEQMLKYIGKAGYGIAGEGISKEDFTGKLFISAIFSTLTAGARFLTSIPEIMIKKLGGTTGYTDTDSIIYKLLQSKRSIITEFFKDISVLRNETDYGKILKAFITKKKKYAFLSENINEKKFKDQFLKLSDGNYIVGKIHGKASYDKKNFSNTIFHIYNDLFKSFTTEKTNIKQTVIKHKNKHPRFKRYSYESRENPLSKGILKFYHKTRSINYRYKDEYNEKQTKKIRVNQPTFLLHKTKFDNFDIFIFYDIIDNKILVTNLYESPIRMNFGIYTNLAKYRVKILYTIPLGEETQLDWENRFLQFIIKIFQKNQDDFYFKIQEKQVEFILKFAKTTKQFLKEKLKEAEIYFKEENFKELFNNYFSQLSIPIAKNKWFFNRTYHIENNSFNKETKLWHKFANNNGDWLTSHHPDTEEFNDLSLQEKILINKLMNKIGIEAIKPPTVKELKAIAKYYQIPNYSKMNKKELLENTYRLWERDNKPSKRLEDLWEKISEYRDYSPDGRIHWIIDEIMNTNTIEYDQYIETSDIILKPINPNDRENITGYQLWRTFFNQIQRQFINSAINKDDITTKLIKYFSFDKSVFHRHIKEKHPLYYELVVEKQKQKEESPEMFTHNVLNHPYFTDGVDYRLYTHLDRLDFAEELLANANTLHSQNLINLGRIASYIYYKTHNREDAIPKIFSKNPTDLPCPKTNTNIHVPFRMRLLIDPYKEKPQTKHDIRMAFDNLEIKKLTKQEIINETEKNYIVLDSKRLEEFVFQNIIKKSYMIFGLPKPENKTSEFPIYYEKQWLKNNWSFEIKSNKGKSSLTYNSKLLIKFVIGNKRVLMCDLHVNPNSHNLLNIELFQTTVKELEADDWIVKELLVNLFTIKELAFFTRNSSITIEDMKTKSDLSYLRKTFYLATSHMILENNIRNNSQSKIGWVSLTGQIQLKHTTPTIFFAHLNTAILEEFNKWLKKQPKTKAMKILSKEVCPQPHKASKGITINHFLDGVAISLYTKDEHWYRSKIGRVAHYRKIPLSEELSNEIMSKVWLENTIRYEITLFGFEAIHTYEYHSILNDLEQFFLQLDELFKQNPEATEVFKKHVNKIRTILPNPLYSNKYQTKREKIIKHTRQWFNTKKDLSGYSILLDKPPPYVAAA